MRTSCWKAPLVTLSILGALQCRAPQDRNHGSAAGASLPAQPNIIVILADDLGCGDMSLYDGWIETPRIDAMAAQGVRFTDFHSNSSVCSPTRVAFMTGRYQQRLGIVDVIVGHRDKDGLEPGELTLPGLMKQAGYQTAIFGKWHCGTDLRHNPTNHGFDEYVGYLIGASHYHKHKNWMNGTEKQNQEGYSTHIITDHAVDFIERKQDQPFFLYVSHAAVHNPYQTPADGDQSTSDPDQTKQQKYQVMLKELDLGVGKILDTLEALDLDHKTLVFFFSDNGAVRMNPNERPFRGGKFSNYEGGHRVPAVARWPGQIAPGWDSSDLVVGMDLLPTFAQLAGIDVPAERQLDGMSIVDHLVGRAALPEREIFFGYEPKLGTAMRAGKWKLHTKGDVVELYDLSLDIKESKNVAAEFPQQTDHMTAAIQRWKAEVTAPAGE